MTLVTRCVTTRRPPYETALIWTNAHRLSDDPPMPVLGANLVNAQESAFSGLLYVAWSIRRPS
jgi:hypothetical protein